MKSRQSPRTLVARLGGLYLAALAAVVFLGASAAPSNAYWVCSPFETVNRGADFRCQNGTYRSQISYIQKRTLGSYHSYGLYRSSCAGCGSISGTEYTSSNSDYLKDFGCLSGYPNAHNRHSVTITVEYTLAGQGAC